MTALQKEIKWNNVVSTNQNLSHADAKEEFFLKGSKTFLGYIDKDSYVRYSDELTEEEQSAFLSALDYMAITAYKIHGFER